MPDLLSASWLHMAGHGPALQALAVIAGTFVLEDATTVIAAAQAQAGAISTPVALGALYVGIVLGDIGLYGLGALSARLRWARRWLPPERMRRGRDWLGGHVVRVVLASRFLPGTRLPVYTACGFLGADFKRFVLAAVVATLAWTSVLFAVSLAVGGVLLDHLGAWRWAGTVGLAAAVIVAGRGLAKLREGKEQGW